MAALVFRELTVLDLVLVISSLVFVFYQPIVSGKNFEAAFQGRLF